MDKLTSELMARLDLLAAKLGVTIDHLWSVLVRQAYIETAYAVGAILLACTFVLTALRYTKACIYAKPPQKGYLALKAAVIYILAVISVGMALANINAIGYALNPEMFALKTVKGLFGGN